VDVHVDMDVDDHYRAHQTGSIIARVRPEQATMVTPFRSRDVRALVNHVVQDLRQFTASASGQEWEQDDSDVVGDDWAGAYRRLPMCCWRPGGARVPLSGWSSCQSARSRPSGRSPADHRPGRPRLGRGQGDPPVHRPRPAVGQLALEWGRENLKPQFRGDEESGHAFGTEVPVADDAPLYDRLAGFFGRDPRCAAELGAG
jgi:hypothetical protein